MKLINKLMIFIAFMPIKLNSLALYGVCKGGYGSGSF